MKKTTATPWLQTLFCSIILVILTDQFSKWLVTRWQLPLLINQGVAFSWFSVQPAWLVTLASISLVAVVAWFGRSWWQEHPAVTGLFFGGALSNIFDRVVWGGVRDWLPVPGLALHNNLADWSIALAVIFFLAVELKTISSSLRGT